MTRRGVYRVTLDLSRCSCNTFAGFGVPCRHILFIAEQDDIVLDPIKYNQRWIITNVNIS